ncbi:MAG: L7Ae/L30e/S12e/Gadd45 family ribosomal protein [Negativicutes bacterium]|nr:L7Ae/L30e/S12e/Gadd45 family ribosomal protein [Negativicutes bacterium]
MNEQRVLQWLGLARRANRLAWGDKACELSLLSGRAELVVVAADAGHNIRKKFHRLCGEHRVAVVVFASRQDIGRALGKETVAVAAIEDRGIAREILTAN